MSSNVFCFQLKHPMTINDAELSMGLALVAAEAFLGRNQVRRDVLFHIDKTHNAIFMDGTSPAGWILSVFLTLFLTDDIGDEGFALTRVGTPPTENLRRLNPT